ncbi:MAG: hypothetical protein OHK0046_09800 [Anaerolineae bacterium]
MPEVPDNATRALILDVAEDLFSKRGFAAVKLRDIAEAVNMKHASLYYYVPGGKDQLFIEVMERSFHRHQQGIAQAIENAGDSLRAQLYAVADWFVMQPAMDIGRMQQGDRPDMAVAEMQRLMALAYNAVRMPIVAALERAAAHEHLHMADYSLGAMALVSAIQSLHAIPIALSVTDRKNLGHQLVDMFLDGWRAR